MRGMGFERHSIVLLADIEAFISTESMPLIPI